MTTLAFQRFGQDRVKTCVWRIFYDLSIYSLDIVNILAKIDTINKPKPWLFIIIILKLNPLNKILIKMVFHTNLGGAVEENLTKPSKGWWEMKPSVLAPASGFKFSSVAFNFNQFFNLFRHNYTRIFFIIVPFKLWKLDEGLNILGCSCVLFLSACLLGKT